MASRNIIIAVCLGLFLILLYFTALTNSYRMPPGYNYDSDFGRDLLAMKKIIQGNFTLVGPQFSFAGLRLAPYHFYLFAPFLFLGQGDYRFVVYANACLFLIGFIILFFFIQRKKGIFFALGAIIWFITSPYLILASRSPGNAFSYLMPLTIYLFYLLFIPNLSLKKSLFLGFVGGIFINYHPISIFSVILPFFVLLYSYKNDLKSKLSNLICFILSMLVSFFPVFVFDIRHKFIIIKSVFSGRMTEFFTTGKPLWQSFIEVNSISWSLLPVSLVGLVLLIITITLFQKKKNYLLMLISIISSLFLLFVGKGAIHYFFPTLILLQVILIISLNNYKYSYFLLLVLIAMNLIYFPQKLYQPARNLHNIEISFNQILAQADIPKKNLNIILINDTYLSAVGYEYRFLLTKYGYKLDDEFSYVQSQYLLLISEKGQEALKNFKSWEVEQFGIRKLINKFENNNLSIYLFEKS